jgi:S-formylglutathione hydrolase FrmB
LENGPAIYFCAGDSESRTMLLYVEELIPILQKSGLNSERIFYRKVEGGKHSEATWKEEFNEAWNWISNQY